jgi:ABC-2 type transport system permease protein
MSILGSLLGLLVSAHPTDQTSDVMLIMNLIKFPLLFISGIFIPLDLLPLSAIILSFFSPLSFLTDLFRYCVNGHSFFPYQLDILILIIWIVVLFLINAYIHSKTMPKRFGESRSMPMKKNQMQGMQK